MAGAIQTPVTDLYGTPAPLFAALHEEFGFTIDLAASHAMPVRFEKKGRVYELDAQATNLLPRWFGAGGIAEDALSADWSTERGFQNPPFSLVHQFIPKAVESARAGGLVVALIKVLSETAIWHECVMPYADRVRFIRGRLSYGQLDGTKASATFPSCIVIFRPGLERTPSPQFVSCDRVGRPLPARLLEAA